MSLPVPLRRVAVLVLGVLAVLAASMGVARRPRQRLVHRRRSRRLRQADVPRAQRERHRQHGQSCASRSRRRRRWRRCAPSRCPGGRSRSPAPTSSEPLDNHGQEITSYVSVVEFRAEAGGGIGPGEFQEFSLSGGPFPDVDAVAFPTVQTYSDGSETAWIDPVVEGQDEPEHPTPTLSLTADGSGDGHVRRGCDGDRFRHGGVRRRRRGLRHGGDRSGGRDPRHCSPGSAVSPSGCTARRRTVAP